ncbi:MAG: hypothetical protein ACW99U_18730 [Candidatus Thorarchaeota archaeon]
MKKKAHIDENDKWHLAGEGLEGRHAFLDKLKQFFIDCGIMSKTDASIYVLGLRKRIITTRDVVEKMRMRQNTAGAHLRRLSREGYFEETPYSGGGKGRARKFKAVHVKTAMPKLLEGLKDFRESLALLDEHMEMPVEGDPEEDIWILSPQRVAVSGLIDLVNSSKKSIKINSHDCTWLEDEDLTSALESAETRKVNVTIIANDAGIERIERNLSASSGIETVCGNCRSPAFVIIDSETVVLSLRLKGISSEYHGLKISSKELVENFSNLFEELKKTKG